MTQSNANYRLPGEESLAQRELAATIAEETSRWLRNGLVRLRAGISHEIQRAGRALQVAIAQVSGNAPKRSCESPRGADGWCGRPDLQDLGSGRKRLSSVWRVGDNI